MLQFLSDTDGAELDLKLRVFQIFLLLHLTFRMLIEALDARGTGDSTPWLTMTALMGLCFLVGLRARWSRLATGGALVLLLAVVFWLHGVVYSFSNHLFIEVVCAALLTFWNGRLEVERELLQNSLRAFTVIILFYTGLQKLWYGTYFDGQFLAHRMSIEPAFATVFGYLMSEGELQRLLAYSGTVGDGPYRVDSVPFVLVSNLTYVAEMGLAAMLAIPRLRRAGVVGALLLLVLIESAAREFEFGALFTNLTLLFLPWAANRFVLWPLAGMYAVIVIMKLGWIPAFHVT